MPGVVVDLRRRSVLCADADVVVQHVEGSVDTARVGIDSHERRSVMALSNREGWEETLGMF